MVKSLKSFIESVAKKTKPGVYTYKNLNIEIHVFKNKDTHVTFYNNNCTASIAFSSKTDRKYVFLSLVECHNGTINIIMTSLLYYYTLKKFTVPLILNDTSEKNGMSIFEWNVFQYIKGKKPQITEFYERWNFQYDPRVRNLVLRILQSKIPEKTKQNLLYDTFNLEGASAYWEPMSKGELIKKLSHLDNTSIFAEALRFNKNILRKSAKKILIRKK